MGNNQTSGDDKDNIYLNEDGISVPFSEQQEVLQKRRPQAITMNRLCSQNESVISPRNGVGKKKKKSNLNGNRIDSCLGCIQADQNELLFDRDELNINFDQSKPKGRITTHSIAYLTPNEINFFKSSATRNVSAIRFFLKKGVNINILDEERTSPLHVACRHGSFQIVEELLNCGADTDLTDIAGWTPLHVAAFFQRDSICDLLLEKGAKH